jgi:hypothetical protein
MLVDKVDEPERGGYSTIVAKVEENIPPECKRGLTSLKNCQLYNGVYVNMTRLRWEVNKIVDRLMIYYVSFQNMTAYRMTYGHIGFLVELHSENPDEWPMLLDEMPELKDSRSYRSTRLCCPYCGSSDVSYDLVRGSGSAGNRESTCDSPAFMSNGLDFFRDETPDENYIEHTVNVKRRNLRTRSKEHPLGKWEIEKVKIGYVPECDYWNYENSEIMNNQKESDKAYALDRVDIINDLYDEKWEHEAIESIRLIIKGNRRRHKVGVSTVRPESRPNLWVLDISNKHATISNRVYMNDVSGEYHSYATPIKE